MEIDALEMRPCLLSLGYKGPVLVVLGLFKPFMHLLVQKTIFSCVFQVVLADCKMFDLT